MTPLPLNPTGHEWAVLKTYIEQRRAEILETMDSLEITDQERFECAVRRDELLVLLNAPADTADAVRAALEGRQETTRTY